MRRQLSATCGATLRKAARLARCRRADCGRVTALSLENKRASPLFAILTHSLSRKSFPCHSYANTRDRSVTPPRFFSPLATRHWPRHSDRSSIYFRSNTCKSVSKQRALTPFRINTYEKHREGGGVPRSGSSARALCGGAGAVEEEVAFTGVAGEGGSAGELLLGFGETAELEEEVAANTGQEMVGLERGLGG